MPVAHLEACREKDRVSMGREMRLSSHDEIAVNYKLCNDNEKENDIRVLCHTERISYRYPYTFCAVRGHKIYSILVTRSAAFYLILMRARGKIIQSCFIGKRCSIAIKWSN